MRLSVRAYLMINKLISKTFLRKSKIVKNINKSIKNHLRSEFVIINGNKIFLDKNDSLGLSLTAYDEDETDVIVKSIKPDDVVLDIGAHIGYYTLLMANLVGKNGQVIAIEPDPDNFKLLEKNVKVNNITNVKLINAAASDVSGKATLYTSDQNSGTNRLYKSKYGNGEIPTKTIKLDDILNGKKIDFIKIDVEGYELHVIKGLIKTLKKWKPTIFAEYIPDVLKDAGSSPKEYISLLASLNYKITKTNEKMIYCIKPSEAIK